jgi:hypothetical protein
MRKAIKCVRGPSLRGRVTKYDTSWDLRETAKGNLPGNEAAFNRKFRIWECRDWAAWLNRNLSFPFTAKRTDDDDDAYFTDIAEHEPFRLGHRMMIVEIRPESHPRRGVMARVKEGKDTGLAPLADLEVESKTNPNYWPVREYTIWYANR